MISLLYFVSVKYGFLYQINTTKLMIRISGESSTPASKIIGAAQNDSYKKEAMDSVQEKTV